MIVEAIGSLFFGVANFFVSLLPQFPSFSALKVSIDPVLYVLNAVNTFVSLKLIGACMVIVFTVYNIQFIWSILMWVIRKIPGVS